VAGYVGDLDQVGAALHRRGQRSPARRLWPAKAEASSPSLAAAVLTMVATLRAARQAAFLYFDDDRDPDLRSDGGVKICLDVRRLNSNNQRVTSYFFPRAKVRALIPPPHRRIDGEVAS
jgi:hypothetical protein